MAIRYVLGVIETLDPVRDGRRILALAWRWHFQRDAELSFTLCLLSACAMPAVPALMGLAPQRADSAELLELRAVLARLRLLGVYSRAGRRLLRGLLAGLAHSALGPDDLLYLVSLFATEERRFNARFGWRKFGAPEKIAAFNHWRDAALRLRLRPSPQDFAAMESFRDAYEQTHRRVSPQGGQLARLVLADAVAELPRGRRAAARSLLIALLPAPLRASLGLRRPLLAPLLLLGLRLGAWARALLPDPYLPRMRHPATQAAPATVKKSSGARSEIS